MTNSGDVSDPERFEVFNRHRALLFSIAYRMLGSAADAEDMVQESYIRWQQAPEEEVRSPRAFLVTIVSRLCINHLQSARVQREAYFGQWLPEPLLTAPLDGGPAEISRIDESLSMAFLVLLERLSPIERAVFLLREVFDYEYPEIAAILRLNEPNCRQILRRARQHIAEKRPRFETSRKDHENLLHSFVEAVSEGDLDGIVSLLAKDAIFYSDGGGKAPALPKPVNGAINVARAILGGLQKFVPRDLVSLVAEINGRPGVINYLHGRPYAVLTIDVAGGLIESIYLVSNPEKLEHIPGAGRPGTH
jgi:RNA polymerase sigma-70 factor (ECF subfamily)